MGYEVEVKYRLVDHDQLDRRLAERGADREPEISQEDIYLSHPSRDFAATNEALRIRRIGAENRITYKGPRLSGPTKTREEIEISVTSGDAAFNQLLRLFENLGFRPVATIRKSRTPFHLNRQGRAVEVVLDRAARSGRFRRDRGARGRPSRSCRRPRRRFWPWPRTGSDRSRTQIIPSDVARVSGRPGRALGRLRKTPSARSRLRPRKPFATRLVRPVPLW